MEDQQVAQHAPVFTGKELNQVLFDFLRGIRFRESQEVRNALNVRINDYALVDIEAVAEDHVRRLPTDSWERS